MCVSLQTPRGRGEFPFTDEMLECETGSLLGRVADLERQSLVQRDEIVCLRATLADALRRIAQLEGRDKREDERNERRSERLVSSPLRNGHVSLRSKLDTHPKRCARHRLWKPASGHSMLPRCLNPL